MNLLDDGAVLGVDAEDFIRVDLVKHPQRAVGAKLKVVRFLAALNLEQLFHALGDNGHIGVGACRMQTGHKGAAA